MKSIGVFVRGECLVYLYPSRENSWKFRSTNTIDRSCKDGTKEKFVFRSNPYNSVKEAMPFVFRFISKHYSVDINSLKPDEIELKKVPFSGRVSPTDVPGFVWNKLDEVLSSEDPICAGSSEGLDDDEDEDESAPDKADDENDDDPGF